MKKVGAAHGRTLELIRQAVLAPSSHNTQPWLFRVSDAVIELRADGRRALPVNDPDDRELTMSCGCASMNLRRRGSLRFFPAGAPVARCRRSGGARSGYHHACMRFGSSRRGSFGI